MKKFGGRLGALVLGSAVSLGATHAAHAACAAGDIAGKWNLYASHYFVDADGPPEVMACAVQLTQQDDSPIRYSISGSCKSYATDSAAAINATVTSGSTLTETTGCKFGGSFKLDLQTIAILDARIEGTTPKRSITGIARRTVTPNSNYQLFDFTFQR